MVVIVCWVQTCIHLVPCVDDVSVLVLAASLAVGYNASMHKNATLSCLLLRTFAGQTQACKPIVKHLVNKHIGMLS